MVPVTGCCYVTVALRFYVLRLFTVTVTLLVALLFAITHGYVYPLRLFDVDYTVTVDCTPRITLFAFVYRCTSLRITFPLVARTR